MTVVELDRPWIDLPFLLQGLKIKDQFEIRILQKYCKHVFIEHDYSESLDLANTERLVQKPSKAASEAPATIRKNQSIQQKAVRSLKPQTSLEHELARARHVYIEVKDHIEQIFSAAEQNQKIDVHNTCSVVKQCISSILSNANALFWLNRIQDSSTKEAEHSMSVAILSIALGHYLGMRTHQLEQLGVGALLHDIGKTRLPKEILQKQTELSLAEKRVLERHAIIGYELLNADTELEPIIKEIALCHHQRPDGRGYPKQERNSNLSVYTKIVSVVDAYDKMTRDNSYRKPLSPRLTLKEIYQNAGSQFDADVAKAFIRMVGIYPAGSLVKMTNGEVAIVVSSDAKHKLTPIVELIYDTNGNIRMPLSLDLKRKPLDRQGSPYQIAGSLADDSVGMDMKHYIAGRLNIPVF